MKIIFLDLDGVCNSREWYFSDDYHYNRFIDPDICPEVINRINRLCKETGAKIVISSSWKYNEGYKDRLEKAGLKNIIDKTPDFIFNDDYCRGYEIEAWLKDHSNVQYVIIDDDKDFYENQLPFFVHTSWAKGFTESDYNKALEILSRCPNGKGQVCKT